ncbi:MAG: HAD family hydrolase [Pyrinomonadaceae bacterium]|nr:HAD family hydrolase [Pyrinomonadaceae bacterium]
MIEKRKAVFLDRDGTIIKEVNFLSTVEETELFPYTIEALKMFRDKGYLLFVGTIQSGIARGYFGASAVNSIHNKIQDELDAEDVKIESFHFCPHFPDQGCKCRKPNTGMIEQACANFEVDLSKSWMIGDKKLDIGMGFNAGTRTALVLTGYGQKHQNELQQKPDIIAENILEVAKIVANGDK